MRKFLVSAFFAGSVFNAIGQTNNYIVTTTTAPTTVPLNVTNNGNIVNNNPTNGWIGLTGDLPGYTSGAFPTLKSSGTLYFSSGGKYSAYLGGAVDPMFGLNDASANTKVNLNTNGTSYLNGGSVGIGTSAPGSLLTLNKSGSGGQTLDLGLQSNGINVARFGWNNAGYVDISSMYNNNHIVLSPTGAGNVGIGTTSPTYKFHVSAVDASVQQRFQRTGSSTGITDVGVDNQGFKFFVGGYDATTLKVLYGANGNVGIGTFSPDATLTVNGNIHSKEVKVDLAVPGPDYVFEKDYQLTSLEDIKTYIDQNKHLPEVPSAKEMEKDGVQIGEMNMLLLKKIEELTLYVIESKKEINDLKNDNRKLKEKIENLETNK